MNLNSFFVKEDDAIVEALEHIDKTGRKCVFVLNEQGELVASLADGDVRRFILKNGTSRGLVREAANYHPVIVREENRQEAIFLLKEKGLTVVPVVNEKLHPVDLIYEGSTKVDNNQRLDYPIPVVMMAGGIGSRLMPITAVLPKPLVPVNEKPIAEHIIDRFCEAGCNRFLLVLNYKKGMIKAYFDDIDHNYEIEYIDEEEFLGTGGGLKLAASSLDEAFIFTNCDILVDVNWKSLYKIHRESKNSITVVCSLKHFSIPYGTINIAQGGEIESMTEKPSISSLVNTGVYLVEPEVLDYIEEDECIGFPDIIMRCQQAGLKVGVYPVSEGSWLDMGQFEELRHMINALDNNDVV